MGSQTTPNPGARRLAVAIALATVAAMAIGWLAVGSANAGSGGVGPGAGPERAQRHDGRYGRLWERVSAGERRWAHRTSACESGGNPNAIGGGGRYRGAFQFLRSTWKSSPKSPGGDPIAYPYRTQAVVAVLLKRRDGAGHWPVCG